MAGVPLLNGFLSKEMFFAEAHRDRTGTRSSTPRPLRRRCWPAPSPSPIRCASSTACSSARRRPTCRASRTSRRVWMRFPIELLVLACLVVGIVPALTVGPFLHSAARVRPRRRHARLQPRDLARLQPAAADERGRAGRRHRALSRCCRPAISRGPEGPPLLRRLKGQRIFERVLVTFSWRWARALDALARHRAACSRSCAAGARGAHRALACAADARASLRGAVCVTGVDPAFALVWPIGIACAHRRRLSGEVPPPRRAGAARRRRARHLHHLRLVLRARSRADPAAGRDRHHGADPARPALAAEAASRRSPATRSRSRAAAPRPRPRHRGRRRRRHAAHRLCGHDPAAAERPSRATSWSTPIRKAAAPTSSTSSWSTSAASTPSARSPCSASSALTVFALLRRFRPAPDSVEIAGAAAHPERVRRRRARPQARRHGQRLSAGPLGHHAVAVPGDHRVRGLPVPARPRPAGRRLRRRHRDGGRLHPAVHGRRHALGRGPAAHPAGALDRRRPAARRRDRGRLLAVRLSVPDARLRAT